MTVHEVTKESVLAEFRPECSCDPWCHDEDACHADEIGAERMADEIVRLRAAIAAAPRVTVTHRYATVDAFGQVASTGSTRAYVEGRRERLDESYPQCAPHRVVREWHESINEASETEPVKRVALLDEPTTTGDSNG